MNADRERDVINKETASPIRIFKSRNERGGQRAHDGIIDPDAGLIPTQLFTRLAETGGREEEVRVPLPATPGLWQVKEAVITYDPGAEARPIDLSVVRFGAAPIGPPAGLRRSPTGRGMRCAAIPLWRASRATWGWRRPLLP